MLEQVLHNEFDQAFQNFTLWKPNNRAAGWPDRGVQLHASVLVWIELKVISLRSDGRILLNNLEKEQAAFMFKWSRRGGYCFVLVTVIDTRENKIGYAIIRPIIYNDWLRVRQRVYSIDELIHMDTMNQILNWFRATYVSQDRYARKE